MRVLVIEDDAILRESLVKQLTAAGYSTEQAADGREGLYFALEYPVDLAIVDLGLPEISGLDIIREVREKGKAYPILILTARDRWQDKVDGLSAGADDYVVKPFHFEEIEARVSALLRRSGGWASSILTAGPVRLDMSRQDVSVSGSTVDLTSFEYKIMEYLMLRAGEVISKSELTDRLYDQDFERDSNVIEVFIGRLRKKLDPDNSLKPIETLRGRGYRFALNRAEAG
jgi:two-component system response regulator PhoP